MKEIQVVDSLFYNKTQNTLQRVALTPDSVQAVIVAGGLEEAAEQNIFLSAINPRIEMIMDYEYVLVPLNAMDEFDVN